MISLIKESITDVGIKVAGEMTKAGISGLGMSEGEGWKDQLIDWFKNIQVMYETIPPEQREDLGKFVGVILTAAIALIGFGPFLYALGSDTDPNKRKNK